MEHRVKPKLGSGVLELSTLQTYVHVTADRANLKVQFSDEVKGPATSKNTIFLPTPTTNISEDDITMLRHAVLHEVGHHTKGVDAFPIIEENNLQSGEEPLGSLLNAFEDCRIERELAKDYSGDKEILIEGRAISYSRKDFSKMSRITPDNKEHTMIATALNLVAETDSEWNPSDVMYKEPLYDSSPKHVKDILAKCKSLGIPDRLKTASTANEVFDIAKQVYELIYEKSADEHIKERKAMPRKKKGGEGEGEDEGKESEGKGKSEKGKAADRLKEAWAEYMPTIMDVGEERPGAEGGGLHLDYTKHDPGKWNRFEPCLENETSVWDVKSHKDIGKARSPHMGLPTNTSWVMSYKDQGNVKTLANRVRRFLQVKAQAYYVGNQTKGKVHQKNLYRVGVPLVGDGTWNSKVFKVKEENDVLDVAVSVLVDYSGSMRDEKIRNAIKASMILTECLSHGLRVPVEVAGFTENGCKLNMVLIKQFDDRPSMEVVGARMIPAQTIMCQNNDADSVLFAYNRLRRRKEKRKMLFVLSDGSPASSRPGDAYTYTKTVVESIEKQGIVDIYGIGIQDDNVTRIYKNNEVLSDANELETKLLKIVQRRIINEEVK